MTETEPESLDGRRDLERFRLAAIVAWSDDAIVSKDLDGTIRSWNPAAERIFGYTAEEMVGGSIFRLIPEELHGEEHQLLAQIRAGGHVTSYETTRIRKDGRRIRVSLTLSPIYDDEHRLIGASAIKRDVTEQRRMEEQLAQAQRMEAIGRLAGGVAHDFNNLLTVISGMTALLLRRAPAELTRELEQVALAADRASALTQQLLAFSRRQVPEIGEVRPGEVVRGLEPMLRRLIGENIRLHFQLDDSAGTVRANRGQIEQVVVNLVVNARDAMPDGGDLVVESHDVQVNGEFAREQLRLTPGDYVMLAVSDTGQGMDAVTQASIFEPFFTTKMPGEGTGLGLATVYGIVQQVGGAVYVYSEVGHGSVFKVYFPRSTVGVAAPDPPAPAPQPIRRGTVLLAEDEAAVRGYAREVLEEAGFTVLEAESGEAALALASRYEQSIDLLLTDVVMPGMNGRQLAERLAKARPGCRVLYMSGYTDDVVVRTGAVAAGEMFVQKPFSPTGLVERVSGAMK